MEFNEKVDKQISLIISGDSMNQELGFELNAVLDILNGVESLVEKTYLYSNQKERMSGEDYEKLKIFMQEPRRGSFETELFIQIKDMVIPTLGLLAENGITVWGSVKQAYEYLRLVIDSRKEGKSLEVKSSGENNIIVTGNNNTITINHQIPELSKHLSPTFSKIANKIDGEYVENVSLGNNDEKIYLDKSDKERFRKKSVTSDEVSIYTGKVFSADAKKFTGKIETEDGIYTFEVSEEFQREEFFEVILLKTGFFKCYEKIEIDPSKQEYIKVKGLKIIEFNFD